MRVTTIFVVTTSLFVVACSGAVEPSLEHETEQPPCPVETATADAGVGEPDATPDTSNGYDPCNADFQRGRCDDALLPSVWGFERRCELEGRRAYKDRAGRHFISDELRAKCVSNAVDPAPDDNYIVCCPEY